MMQEHQTSTSILFNFFSPFPAVFCSHAFFTPVLSPFLSLAFVALFGRGGDRTQGLENVKQVLSTNKFHLQLHFTAFYPRYSAIEALVKVKIEERLQEKRYKRQKSTDRFDSEPSEMHQLQAMMPSTHTTPDTSSDALYTQVTDKDPTTLR